MTRPRTPARRRLDNAIDDLIEWGGILLGGAALIVIACAIAFLFFASIALVVYAFTELDLFLNPPAVGPSTP